MQQFVVPQFIEVEDKILGPITTRQFLILLVAGLILVIAYKLADLGLFAIITAIVGIITIVFAFVKINGQTFHYFLLNIFQTIRKPSIRVWRKDYSKDELNYYRKLGTEEGDAAVPERAPPHRAHIRNLALTVNTGGYYKSDDVT